MSRRLRSSGYTVLRFTGPMIEKGYRGVLAVDVIDWALANIEDDG